MASYAEQTTPPTTADRKKDTVLARRHLLSMSPSPWTEPPPTPQDSLASPCQTPPTSPGLQLAEPVSPTPAMLEEDDNISLDLSGNAARTTLLRRSTPTLITIGPKAGRDNRMQHWLSEIPPPVSPQERYIQGLNPAADHPLHPRPLRAVAPRQAQSLGNTGITSDDSFSPFSPFSPKCEQMAIDVPDKENAMIQNRLKEMGNTPAEEAGLGSKKRHLVEVGVFFLLFYLIILLPSAVLLKLSIVL